MPTERIQRPTTKTDLAAFLRTLADALENGGEGGLACVDDFTKIKITARNDFGQMSLKAQIKSASPCTLIEEGQSEEKPAYKVLKKRMRVSFRTLVKMIHDNQYPPQEALDSFLEDSALMITYPGYGDEYYTDYAVACEAFRAACHEKDLQKMGETIDVLIHEKSRCHAKHG